MGLVKTHHARYFAEGRSGRQAGGGISASQLIGPVINAILRESPGTVADVASGKARQEALELMVLKELDKGAYAREAPDREEAIKMTMDYMFGYGPLQKFIEDDDISDIDGTAHDEFSLKRGGERAPADVAFASEQEFDTYCKLIAVRNNGIINENDSHCRVTDEKHRLRINISIRPRNISGPSISIRKHRKNSYRLDDLEALGMMSRETKEFLRGSAVEGKSIVICGKGASGKTTLLRALINCLPEMERVLVCESDSELYPDKKYCIQQRIKKANEGGLQVTLEDLVRDGLTMSLDTYIIGEMVGGEALTFIRAVHSGHRGMATTHAVSAAEGLRRLVTLARSNPENESEQNIKGMISAGLDLVVCMSGFKVTEIYEVGGGGWT